MRKCTFVKVFDAWEIVRMQDYGATVFPGQSASVRSGRASASLDNCRLSSRKTRKLVWCTSKYESPISWRDRLPDGGANEPPKATERRLSSASL